MDGDKEEVYDAKIRPLLDALMDACKDEGLAVAVCISVVCLPNKSVTASSCHVTKDVVYTGMVASVAQFLYEANQLGTIAERN